MDEENTKKSSISKQNSEEFKAKEGFIKLEEKMEEMKNQMATMERKYDEMFKTINKKNPESVPSLSAEQITSLETKKENLSKEKIQRDNNSKEKLRNPFPVSSNTEREDKKDMSKALTNYTEKQDDNKTTSKKPSKLDVEKMEDNPFI